jgi:MoxR-like ATPase
MSMIDHEIFKTHMFCPTRTRGYRETDAGKMVPVFEFGVPLFLWGPPGIAKTERTRQLAHALGLAFREEYTAQRDSSEIAGMYTVDGSGQLQQSLPPWARHAVETERSVVFFDELPLAAKATQDAALTIVQDKNVGGVRLPPGTRFVAAGNAASIGGGREPSSAMANRFAHYECGPDAYAWCEWMLTCGDGGVTGEQANAAEIEAFVESRFDEAYARQRGLLVGFVRNGGTDETTIGSGRLFRMPDRSDQASRRAWLSPRSLERVARMRATADIFGIGDEKRDQITAALVGADTAAMIGQYETDADMPNVAEWLDGKAEWQFDPQRPDRAVSLFSTAAAMVIPDTATRRQERAARFWTEMTPIANGHPDVILMAAQAVSSKRSADGRQVGTGLAALPEAQPVLRQLRPMMQALGMIAKRA